MPTKMKLTFSLLCLSVLIGGGCSGLRSELGLDRHSPDEFTVVKRAPLSLPPDYNLMPPDQDTPLQQTTQTTQQARQIIFGKTQQASTGHNGSGETLLLSQLGADKADPDIRQTLDQEQGFIALESETLAEKIIFWKPVEPQPVLIDPAAESRRLQENKAAGKSINDGEVPTIKRQQGTIDKLF